MNTIVSNASAPAATLAKPEKPAKPAKPQADASKPIVPAVSTEAEAIVIDSIRFLPSRINKHIASHLSDYGRCKPALARFATNGRIGADLKALRLENGKAISEANKSGALNGLISDPAKFTKRALILVRLSQALHDLEAL